MKNYRTIGHALSFLMAFALTGMSTIFGQTTDCNLNFEEGNTNTWFLSTGTRTGLDVNPWDYTMGPFTPFYHQMTTGGMSPYFPNVFDGDYSFKLGDLGGPDQKISAAFNSFLVDECNTEFTFSYALILEDAFHGGPDHEDHEGDAFFSYKVTSPSGVIDELTKVADLGDSYFDETDLNYCVKHWTTVTLDLSPYVGEVVTISFLTSDCYLHADEAVAYIDCECPSGRAEDIDGEIFCTLSSYPLPDPFNEGVWSGPMVISAGGNEYFSPTTPGEYTLTFTYGPGCYEEATVTVGATPIPNITNLIHTCEGNCDGAIEVENLTGWVAWHIEGPGVWYNTEGTTFSYEGLCAGDYTLEVEDPVTRECHKILEFTIEDNEALWHKTTENTLGMETGNDVVTDAQNNVYVVGDYHHITELQGGNNPNILLDPAGATPDGCMYVAKYDACGDLIWAARSSNSNKCTGNSLAIDESNGMVYVTGDIRQQALFHSAESADGLCDAGISVNLVSVDGDAGYIAQYDMNTGCLYFVEEYDVGIFVNSRTITTNETNGEVFVGGHFLQSSATPNHYAYIQKFDPVTGLGTGNTLGAVTTSIIENAFYSTSHGQVNDLDYDEANDRLYAIGNFEQYLSLTNGVDVASVDGFLSWSPEAFLLTYDEASPTPFYDLRTGGNTQGMYMTGEGVSVSSTTGRAYLTGSYKFTGDVGAPLVELYAPYSLSVDQPLKYIDNDGSVSDTDMDPWASYMIALDHSEASPSWVRYINVSSNDVNEAIGVDVVCRDGKVSFLNTFSGTGMILSPGGGWGVGLPYVGALPGGKRVGVINYSEDGTRNWLNVTEGVSTTSIDDHVGESITADNDGHCFVTGGYKDMMGYFTGVPESGDLIKTGSGMRNAFIMRVQQDEMGAFRVGESNNVEESEKEIHQLKIHPNPSNGIVFVDFDVETTTQLELINSLGQKIEVNFERTDVGRKFDISQLPDGVYFLRLNFGNEWKTERIVKN